MRKKIKINSEEEIERVIEIDNDDSLYREYITQ